MTESIEYNIEALTPIHVGNGRKLSSKYNYYPENGTIRIVDIESVIEALAGNELAIKEFGRENFNICEFLNDYSIKPEGYNLSWKCSKAAPSKKDTHNSAKPANLTWQEQLGKAFNIDYDLPHLPQNIREHIKTAFGKPYLPGSSIKGSIRTAILSQFIVMDCSRALANMPQSGKDYPKDKFASQKVASCAGKI